MSRNAVVSSISTEFQAASAAWIMMFKERFYLYGRSYAIDWIFRPVFDLSIAALIYAGGRDDLVPYVIVAMAANSFLFSAIYWVGEILDRERMRGTLVSLFLAPCSRASWMAGYAGAAVGETVFRTAIMLLAGYILFGVTLDPNVGTLAIVFPLYILSLTGIALTLSGVGLVLKKSNALSNLVSPFFILLGGVYYPIAELPDWLRIPARMLPIGYGIESITAATLEGATLGQIQGSLLPLLGFAIVSPIVGIAAFNALEHLVRRRGEIDLY